MVIPWGAYSQSQGFALGNFSFFLSPKILKEGSIIDAGLDLQYTQRWSGEIRFRNTLIAKNEELLVDLADSLNAVNENTFEVFYGSDADAALKNTAKNGVAVVVTLMRDSYKRNTTAGETVSLSSSGSANWE